MIKEIINEWRATNGNQDFTQKDMIIYLVAKIDKIDEKLEAGGGVVAVNGANIRNIWYVFSGISVVVLSTLAYLIFGG